MLKKRNMNGGFSLIEILVAFAVLGILSSFLIPSLITSSQHADQEKDSMKFESICTAFKKASAEPEVKKEMDRISGGGEVIIICEFDEDGMLNLPDSQIVGVEKVKLKESKLWLNAYQSIGETYEAESDGLEEKFITFYLQPKSEITNSNCEYNITEKSPETQPCTIQVASLSDRDTAEAKKDELINSGYTAEVGLDSETGKYNVYVGSYPSIQSAMKVRSKLNDLGYGAIVKTK